MELAAYRAVVKSIPGQFHEPMSQRARDRLVDTIKSLESGGDLGSLGLAKNQPSLATLLDDDKFDTQATIALLEDGRLRPAQTKLELLGAKLDRIYAKRLRLLRYLLLLAIGGGALMLLYMLILLFKARPKVSDEISPLSEFNASSAQIKQTFAERLSVIVDQEVRFGFNRAQISCIGFDLPNIRTSLMDSVEHITENLVRNSVIHGGRPADQRLLAGKPDELSIRASFQVRDNDYLLSVWDNGEGMDPNVIIASALELGLISHSAASALPVTQAVKLIFLPNFTTRINVQSKPDDDLGLDALREIAKQQGGIFSIQNQPGISCQFSIRFPKS